MVKRADRKQLGVTAGEAPSPTVLTPRELRVEMYRQTFLGDGPGAAVLEDLKKNFSDRRSFVPDSNATAFHEGQRDIYRMIVNLISDRPAVNVQTEEQPSA